MSTYRLDKILCPRSVVVVGASPRQTSPGGAVLRNLRRRGFAGAIHLVNPHYDAIDGVSAVKSYAQLAEAPDLAVIGIPPAAVPSVVADAAAKGTAAAIILTAGLGHGPGSLAEQCEKAARTTGMRLIGPNCLGVLVPAVNLNASFAASTPRSGDLAVISQSGAIAAGLVEWAAMRGIGFSGIVSIGDSIDVDLADLLDFFAMDRPTRAILLYIESIKDARKFMSAARAAARAKPVLIIKTGRHAQGARAAMTHTGALAGSDAVYDAAFRRAGLLRVLDLDELFAAAETLGHLTTLAGKRLAILTNGGGVGVLAVDRLADLGGELANISAATMKKLDAALPPIWSHGNPVDIAGDADERRYAVALEQLLDDEANDAVLVMNVPTALASAAAAAKSVITVTERHRRQHTPAKPVFAVWIGGSDPAAAAFDAAGIPSYATESDAVGSFMHLVHYQETRDQLMATPPSLPQDFAPNGAAVRRVIDAVLAEQRTWLDPIELTTVFSAYEIPITPAALARNPDEAVATARPHLAAGNAVVLKILSPDIVHKSEVGGVRLNLIAEQDVRQAAADILQRAHAAKPEARIAGITVFPMIVRPKARELIVGVADDPTFGPVMVFGRGGTAVEVINDKALALPPLDLALARELIGRTRVSRVLKAYRNVPAADEQAIALLLVKLSQLVADFAEISEIDLNPVLADETGVIAVDARLAVAAVTPRHGGRAGRFAIRPYPKVWERHAALPDGTKLLVRPVRPEDEPLFPPFFAKVTQQDLRLRFFGPMKQFSHAFIARLTQIDYARAMAFIAIDESTGQMLGAVRIHADAEYEIAEYAILVRSDLK
ncbi:MAG TPA: acetate--CoA ligase family protein, partial [Xanthobacteraceae bacterium]|nr:acetate--CoA ligase family protein [Xanthobacteraceae bacterium]